MFNNTLPNSLRQLTALEDFAIEGNAFTGPFPAQVLEQWTNLRSIYVGWIAYGEDLGGNSFTGPIPTTVGRLTMLREFYFDNNNFSGPLPTEIGLMTSLIEFQVGNNQLNGAIPEEINSWVNIQDAHFNANMFTGAIPDGFCDLPNLDHLTADCTEVICNCPVCDCTYQ